MKISLQMWRNLAEAGVLYRSSGFADFPQPWIASQQAMEVTLPSGAVASVLHGEDLLVGSAEQAFIDRMIHGEMQPGKWQTITPCFRREEQFDSLHHPYFMKLELIDYRPEKPQWALRDMVAQACGVFNRLSPGAPITLEQTDIGEDLMLYGVEIGSYGIRRFQGHEWVYGTGLAEPRFSTVLRRTA